MQRGSTRQVRASALAALALAVGLAVVLATTWSAVPLGSAPTGAATLALAVLAVVALGAFLSRRGADLAPALAGPHALRRSRLCPRTPSRQCDPDAAGHARPRAPGRD